jgi:carboxylate-amine ligase
MKAFAPNEYPTLGVEEEFQLIEPDTGEMTPKVDAVIAAMAPEFRERLCHELFLSVVESRTDVAENVDELVDDVIEGRRRLDAACRNVGTRLVAAGSHPFSRWQDQKYVLSDHYQWVRDHCGTVSHRLLSFGLHIHVGVRSDAAALYVMREMRPWLYPLLAMSANSPFYEGLATGLMSVRTHLFNGMPRTKFPPRFETFQQLEEHYAKLLAAGDVSRPGDLWWSIRPQPPLGTVEIRVMDLPTDAYRIGALAAVYQAAVATYQDAFGAAEPLTAAGACEEYLLQNRWQCMRRGLAATLIDPIGGEIVPVRDFLRRLLDLCQPKAEQLGSSAYLEFARQICEAGNEAERQIALCERLGGDLRELELELARRTIAFDRPF